MQRLLLSSSFFKYASFFEVGEKRGFEVSSDRKKRSLVLRLYRISCLMALFFSGSILLIVYATQVPSGLILTSVGTTSFAKLDTLHTFLPSYCENSKLLILSFLCTSNSLLICSAFRFSLPTSTLGSYPTGSLFMKIRAVLVTSIPTLYASMIA